jgi:hypothetical protein
MPRVQFDRTTAGKSASGRFPSRQNICGLPVEEFQRIPLINPPAQGACAAGIVRRRRGWCVRAGLLNGWTATKQRPEFTIVSGVTRARLHCALRSRPAYDAVIKEIYTGGHAEQFVKAAHFSNLIFRQA